METDGETMASVVKRLKRAQGQIGGVIKMIEEGHSTGLGSRSSRPASSSARPTATAQPTPIALSSNGSFSRLPDIFAD